MRSYISQLLNKITFEFLNFKHLFDNIEMSSNFHNLHTFDTIETCMGDMSDMREMKLSTGGAFWTIIEFPAI